MTPGTQTERLESVRVSARPHTHQQGEEYEGRKDRERGREGGRATGFNKGRRERERERGMAVVGGMPKRRPPERLPAEGRTEGRARQQHHWWARARARISPRKAAFQGQRLRRTNKSGFPFLHCGDLPES